METTNKTRWQRFRWTLTGILYTSGILSTIRFWFKVFLFVLFEAAVFMAGYLSA